MVVNAQAYATIGTRSSAGDLDVYIDELPSVRADHITGAYNLDFHDGRISGVLGLWQSSLPWYHVVFVPAAGAPELPFGAQPGPGLYMFFPEARGGGAVVVEVMRVLQRPPSTVPLYTNSRVLLSSPSPFTVAWLSFRLMVPNASLFHPVENVRLVSVRHLVDGFVDMISGGNVDTSLSVEEDQNNARG